MMDIFRWLMTKIGMRYVILVDHDGARHVRRVIWRGGKPFAVRMGFGIRTVGLEDNGAVSNGCYVDRWEPYEPLAERSWPRVPQ
jgi:hypothetical protein